MEKKLLLLGLLRSQEMHGYQLNDHLSQGAGTAIALSKPNAYKLLKTMEADGWITYHEEREGNRPLRRVYSVTRHGEAAFQHLLRESLVAYPPSEFPNLIALDFLGELSSGEAVTLLRQRQQKVKAAFEELDAIPEDIRQHHLSYEYLHRHYLTALEWVTEIIERLST